MPEKCLSPDRWSGRTYRIAIKKRFPHRYWIIRNKALIKRIFDTALNSALYFSEKGVTLVKATILPWPWIRSKVLKPLMESDMSEEDRFKERCKTGNVPWDIGKPDFNLIETVTRTPIKTCKALDVGCGTGDNTVWLAQKHFRIRRYSRLLKR